MFLKTPAPDYHRFLDTIWLREPDRVPIAELGVDPPVKERFLGKPIRSVETGVEFWWRAGYDYIYLRPAYEFPHTLPRAMTTGEPKAMDIHEVKEQYRRKLALIGNIDMDILARGTPAEVKAQVRQRIRDLAPGGGYAMGANPGIAYYVQQENFGALREAVFEYGRYPITL